MSISVVRMICITCAGSHQCPKPDAAIPRQVDAVVYARHGREVMGWKSPVREPMVFELLDTTKSTSRSQGRKGDRPSEGRRRANVRAVACPGSDPGDRNRIQGLAPGRACLPVGRLGQHNKAPRFKEQGKGPTDPYGICLSARCPGL
jgi:hypothetical protein